MDDMKKWLLRIFGIGIAFVVVAKWFNTTEKTTEAYFKTYRKNKVSNKHLILIYTPLFGRLPWPHLPETYDFTDINGRKCQYNKCQLTYDKKDIGISDVVLFHGRDLPKRNVFDQMKRDVSHERRGSAWVYLMHENPLYTYYDPKEYNGIFNWTVSYRTDSEVYMPYLSRRKIKSNATAERRNYFKGKPKDVLFVNSNCLPWRKKLINKLKEFIDVDVYGGCQHEFKNNLPPCKRKTKQCDEIKHQYKFYLAIENGLCMDYITEKYWIEGLNNGLVPIVIGGADYEDEAVAIPASSINALDFASVEKLGKYLKKVSMNATLYNQYHTWRTKYELYQHNVMCDICKMANYQTNGRYEEAVDLGEFWGKETCGLNKKEFDGLLKTASM